MDTLARKTPIQRVTLRKLQEMMRQEEQITITTAYDWGCAKLFDQAGIDMFVVGDSLGMNLLGYDSTLPVTIEDIIHHTRAVVNARERAMVVADMPFLSYELSDAEGLKNAAKLIKIARADAVKLEGGAEVVELVKKLVRAKIPVMGHLGLTPQSHLMTSGFSRLPGRSEPEIDRLLSDAEALSSAGVFAALLECVPNELAVIVKDRHPQVAWIGLGSGPRLHGQGLVHTDLLGLPSTLRKVPQFVKQYAQLSEAISEAVECFVSEVQSGVFPGQAHSYKTPKQLVDFIECKEKEDKE